MPPDLTPVASPVSTSVGERILAAASELFYERGITATGVDLIAERADTTKRTMYQRFGSKDGLVAAYLTRRAHRWQTLLIAALGEAVGPAGLDTLYDVAEQWAAQNPRGCAFVNAWAELGPGEHRAVRVIQAEKAWMRRIFDHVSGNESAGEALYLLYEGAQIAATIGEDGRSFAAARAASKQLLATAPPGGGDD